MAEKIEYTKLKYIPTGNVFNLPSEDAREVMKTDKGNFEVVGGKDITEKEPQVEETTTYNMVVEETTTATADNTPAPQENEAETTATTETTTATAETTAEAPKLTKTALKAKKLEELVALCEEKKIEVLEADKKSDLIEKLLATNEE